MKITLLFDDELETNDGPWLASAYDEFTYDSWNGVPDFYDEARQHATNPRELVIHVPDSAIRGLYETPELPPTSIRVEDDQ